MGGRVLTSNQIIKKLFELPDLPVFHMGRKGGGATSVELHPHSIVIVFGPRDDSCKGENDE